MFKKIIVFHAKTFSPLEKNLESLLRSESDSLPLSLVSPSLFLKCCSSLKRIYSEKFKEMEETKTVHQGAVERFRKIEQQVKDKSDES